MRLKKCLDLTTPQIKEAMLIMNLEIDYIYSQITEKGEEPSVITNEKHDAL